ncbi:MAG: methionyl-tRNA formyltransferase [Proteobacteria bacterium]|nr:methionyl-tRNA formyltransferase [Pseudomonadota bacterium]
MDFRIIFMGSQDFSVPSLERLVESGCQVEAVVTRPDRPAGRGRKLRSTPVKAAAVSRGLLYLEPASVKNPELMAEMEKLNPDFVVVAAYGGILPGTLLHLPRRGCLGVHPSLLPLYRGANPIRWALLQGETRTGVTIFELAEGIDTGRIILQQALEIRPDDDFGSLSARLAETGAGLLVDALRLFASGKTVFPAQEGPATEAPMFSRENEKLDWSLPAGKVSNWIRALSPSPGAHVFYREKRLKILAARVVPGPRNPAPGLLVESHSEGKSVRVACGEGFLDLVRVQLEGGKPVEIQDFLRGHSLKPGERLGEP